MKGISGKEVSIRIVFKVFTPTFLKASGMKEDDRLFGFLDPNNESNGIFTIYIDSRSNFQHVIWTLFHEISHLVIFLFKSGYKIDSEGKSKGKGKHLDVKTEEEMADKVGAEAVKIFDEYLK